MVTVLTTHSILPSSTREQLVVLRDSESQLNHSIRISAKDVSLYPIGTKIECLSIEQTENGTQIVPEL